MSGWKIHYLSRCISYWRWEFSSFSVMLVKTRGFTSKSSKKTLENKYDNGKFPPFESMHLPWKRWWQCQPVMFVFREGVTWDVTWTPQNTPPPRGLWISAVLALKRCQTVSMPNMCLGLPKMKGWGDVLLKLRRSSRSSWICLSSRWFVTNWFDLEGWKGRSGWKRSKRMSLRFKCRTRSILEVHGGMQ